MRRVRVDTPTGEQPPRPAVEAWVAPPAAVWRVVGGDRGHWRVGYYSPALARAEEVAELERHTCPEVFLLVRGRLTLVVADGGELREVPLAPGVPVCVAAPHSGYCPDGPHQGLAVVVERDAFETEYRASGEWLEGP